MTQEGFTVGLIRVGDNIKKYKLIDFRGRDEVKKDKNRNRFNLLIFKIFRISSVKLVGTKILLLLQYTRLTDIRKCRHSFVHQVGTIAYMTI